MGALDPNNPIALIREPDTALIGLVSGLLVEIRELRGEVQALRKEQARNPDWEIMPEEEAAAYIGVTVKTLRSQYLAKGRIEGTKPGNNWIILAKDFHKARERNFEPIY